jgi:hypothetical protein
MFPIVSNHFVMRGLVPRIRVFPRKTWMAVTSTTMTRRRVNLAETCSSFNVCRIFYRKAGARFSRKCSSCCNWRDLLGTLLPDPSRSSAPT